MLRPRPVPSPTSRVVKNGSKIRRRLASSMPWPGVRHRELDGGSASSNRRGRLQTARRPPAHRLLGVQNQVQQRLLNLAGVGDDRRQPRLVRRLQLDRVEAKVVGTQRQHSGDELPDVLRSPRGGLSSRERQQVAHDPRRALRFVDDPTEILREVRRRRSSIGPRASRSSSSSSCAYPITLVSGLFNSCATPATS